MRFVLAAVPRPPVAIIPELKPRALVLVVLDQELLDIADQHIALLNILHNVQRNSEHRLGIDTEMRAVLVKMLTHFLIVLACINQNHVDKRVQVVGVFLDPLPDSNLRFITLQFLQLFVLVLLEPLLALFEHTGNKCHTIGLCNLQAVDHICCGMRVRTLTPAGEPTPAAIAELHRS